MLERKSYLQEINRFWRDFPILALLGPRQVGKTTLAFQYCQKEFKELPPLNIFDLEDPQSLARLSQPMLALQNLKGLVLIDEIQRMPELFPILRVLADRKRDEAKFLILGSASPELIKGTSETLAGRIRYLEVNPLSLGEVGFKHQNTLWLQGGFPRAFLASDSEVSKEWLEQYVRTFLEKDIPQLGFSIPAIAMRRFWMMLTHYHGQIVNYSELGRSLDISDATVRRYIDILAGSFMIRRLQPWFENIGKRQVKSPKIYFRDSGLFHHLLGVHTQEQLFLHPRLGASWEGFALEEITRHYRVREEECFFWSVHEQSEVDLFFLRNGKRIAFEFKYTDKPSVSKSMRVSLENLKLDFLYVIYPGNISFPLDEKIHAVSFLDLPKF
jgi:predicted AAA+ superfamily ATPase